VVINFTGGETWVPSLRCLKRGGTLLVCGATAGYDPKEDLRYVWSFELKIIGSNSFYDEDLAGLMSLIEQGKMKPVVDKNSSVYCAPKSRKYGGSSHVISHKWYHTTRRIAMPRKPSRTSSRSRAPGGG